MGIFETMPVDCTLVRPQKIFPPESLPAFWDLPESIAALMELPICY